MFLKRIALQDVRGIDQLTLLFTQEDSSSLRQRTLILGENGMGKSTLLRAIALVTAGSDALSTLLADPDEWISHSRSECSIQATLVTQKQQERSISLRIKRHDTLKDIIINNQAALNEIDAALNHANRNYFVVGYGASRRLNQRTDFSSIERNYRNDRAQNVASLFEADTSLYPITAWAMELDYQQPDRLALLKDTLNDLLPSIRFDSIDKKNKQLLFKVGRQKIPLHQLSDGYQNVVAWVGDMLYRMMNTFTDFSSPLETRGVLLIDEIDLHLHPKWQRLIVDYLSVKFPRLQLIATTHSPLTVQQANAGELFFLHRSENGRIALDAFQGSPKQMLIHQLLLSPLFGLATDESVATQQAKDEYRSLKHRKSRSVSEQQRFEELSDQLAQLPLVQRSNFAMDNQQVALLNEVRRELLKRDPQ